MNSGVRLLCALLLSSLAIPSLATESLEWRPVGKLLPDELARVDLNNSATRNSDIPYIPAEPYPFSAPYTVEEMAFRAMEFTQHARWSSIIVDVYGSMTGEGYLDQGVTVTYKQWLADSVGVQGQIETEPGDVYMRMIHYYTYPPRIAGQQHLWQVRRSDKKLKTRLDMFVYTPGLRRVRRIPQPQRDVPFANNAQSFDSIVGRDAWEFSLRLLGADVLHETVRFPDTRPNITLRRADGSYYQKAVADIKLMGDEYSQYTKSGGVPCFVLEAKPKQEWLGNYNDRKLVIWVDQQSFYPLRLESYDASGDLILVEDRIAWLANPDMGEQGYSKFVTTYYDPRVDLMSYTLHDAPQVIQIPAEEGNLVFRPDFMRRNWLKSPLRKSQALVEAPEQYYLRPHLYLDKFPETRTIEIPDYLERRIALQEDAGHMVFDDQVVFPSSQDKTPLSLIQQQSPLDQTEPGFQLTVH